jgi:hypothetical protein
MGKLRSAIKATSGWYRKTSIISLFITLVVLAIAFSFLMSIGPVGWIVIAVMVVGTLATFLDAVLPDN